MLADCLNTTLIKGSVDESELSAITGCERPVKSPLRSGYANVDALRQKVVKLELL